MILPDTQNLLFTANALVGVMQVNGGEPLEVLTDEVRDAIMKNIRRRMTPQPVKIRADVELTCFSYDGILHIQVRDTGCNRMSMSQSQF